MNFIKRNIGLVTFCGIAIILAAILGYLLAKHTAAADKLEAKVQEQKDFFATLKRKNIGITSGNLKTLSSNVKTTENQLFQLRRRLWQQTRVQTKELNSIEAKNALRERLINMRNTLEKRGIQVSETASQFSFGTILQADTLPDEETEVPVILKQIKLVQEIVRLLANSYVDSVDSVQRPFGLHADEREFFDIMPFSLEFSGDSKSVRKFITLLQHESKYLYFIDYLSLSTPNTASNILQQSGERISQARERRGREGRRTSREYSMPENIPSETSRDGSETQEASKLSRQERLIPLQNNVSCTLRISFVEFHNPEQTSQNNVMED